MNNSNNNKSKAVKRLKKQTKTRKSLGMRPNSNNNINNIIKPRSKKTGRIITAASNMAMDYLHCRLNPFTSSSSIGIPDASSVRRVTKDIRVAYNVTIGSSGGFMFHVLPELPRGIAFKDISASPSAGVVVNGRTLSGVRQGPGTGMGTWYGPILPEWNSWALVNPVIDTENNPYYAARMRLVTQSVRVLYTGKTLDCAGTITVTPNDWAVAQDISNNTVGIVQFHSNSTQGATFAANTVKTKPTIAPASLGIIPPGSVTLNSAQGCFVTTKRLNPTRAWVDCTEHMILVETKSTALFACEADISNCTSAFYDPGFQVTSIQVGGATQGSTFRVEMVMCIELEPMMTSVLRDYAKLPPTIPESTIARAETILKQNPIAGDLSFGDRLVNAVRSYGPTVASIAGELVSLAL